MIRQFPEKNLRKSNCIYFRKVCKPLIRIIRKFYDLNRVSFGKMLKYFVKYRELVLSQKLILNFRKKIPLQSTRKSYDTGHCKSGSEMLKPKSEP